MQSIIKIGLMIKILFCVDMRHSRGLGYTSLWPFDRTLKVPSKSWGISCCSNMNILIGPLVQVYSVSQRYFSSSRDSLHAAYVNRGASELDLSRKTRRKDHLRGRFKLPNAVPLTSSREPSHLHGPASTNHLNSNSSCNGTETWVRSPCNDHCPHCKLGRIASSLSIFLDMNYLIELYIIFIPYFWGCGKSNRYSLVFNNFQTDLPIPTKTLLIYFTRCNPGSLILDKKHVFSRPLSLSAINEKWREKKKALITCKGKEKNSSCDLLNFRRYTAQQQQQQRGSRGFPGQPGSRGFRTGAPNWSFVFDPAGRLCYYWSMVVSLAFLYNFWVIIYRFAFQEINGQSSFSRLHVNFQTWSNF